MNDRLIIPWLDGKLGDWYTGYDGVIYLSNIKRVAEFFEKYTKDCVLVSPCSDFNVSFYEGWYYIHEMTNGAVHCRFKEIPPNIKKWFCCNLNIEDDRCVCFPIGTLKTHWDIIDKIDKIQERDKLLYINFTPQNHPSRIDLYKDIIEKGVFNWANVEWPIQGQSEEVYAPTRINFFNQLCKHKFALCPPGNGLDSYRLTECINFGCIPILLDSIWARNFIDLPVLIVKSFLNLSSDFLLEKYLEISTNKYNLEKFTDSFWKNMIFKERDILNANH